MIRAIAAALLIPAAALASSTLPSEITVRLEMAYDAYVEGERIDAVVSVFNQGVSYVDVGGEDSPDRLFVELFRASDRHQIDPIPGERRPFVAPFALSTGKSQKLATRLGDHFAFLDSTRYFARAVLVHAGVRYESSLKSFDVVPGMSSGGALQMFSKRPGLQRAFQLVYWGRDRAEHLFLKARDTGASQHRWQTTDLGPLMRVTPPKISVLDTGEVLVLHRATQDYFIRSEFWSMPDAFEFHMHETMVDPDVAGAERVKSLYRETGLGEPPKPKWYEFWKK